MEELTEQKCEACRVGAPSVTAEEIKEFQPKVPEWQIVNENNIPKLDRVFKFKNFKEAIEFVNKVAEIANKYDHHPDIHIFYNRVLIELTTHEINGISDKDYGVASEMEKLVAS